MTIERNYNKSQKKLKWRSKKNWIRTDPTWQEIWTKLKQIKQNIDQKLQQLEPIATVQINLQTTQANQACDIELLTKNMDYLMKQVANIADRLKQFTMVPNSPMLSSSAGMS